MPFCRVKWSNNFTPTTTASQINMYSDMSAEKIILENSNFSVDFPYFDSLNLSLNHYIKDLKIWLEQPFKSVINSEENFPLIPEEMEKYYENNLNRMSILYRFFELEKHASIFCSKKLQQIFSSIHKKSIYCKKS